ncbi:methyl-accepting chemotaxis protein, partial [Rhodopseudomonas palustris]
MTRLFHNLRIGAKLAIASALGILLVGFIIYAQSTGNAAVRAGYDSAIRHQTVAQLAAEVRASVGGMQLAFRDTVLAATPAALQKSADSFALDQTKATAFSAEMARLIPPGDAQAQIARLPGLIADLNSSRALVAGMRSEIIGLQGAADQMHPDAAARIDGLNDAIAQHRHNVSLPLATQIMTVVGKLVDNGRQQSARSIAAAAAESASAERTSLIAGAITTLLLIATCVFSIVTIARPISAMSRAMHELADGNFAVVLPGLGRGDEIGEVAGAVEKFKVKAQEKATQEAAAQLDQEHRVAEKRKADMGRLADAFEGAVGHIIDTVSAASSELEAAAGSLTATAERAQQLTVMVAAASEEASTNVQSVASATEEMASSVNEIGRQVQDSARIANEAVDQARKTNDRVEQLSDAAARIGAVVELINTIAGQTNLLALNATIEAAR